MQHNNGIHIKMLLLFQRCFKVIMWTLTSKILRIDEKKTSFCKTPKHIFLPEPARELKTIPTALLMFTNLNTLINCRLDDNDFREKKI